MFIIYKMIGVVELLFLVMLSSDIIPKDGGRPEVTSSLQES